MVWADPRELDAWRKSSSGVRLNGNGGNGAAHDRPSRRRLAIAGLLLAASLTATGWVVLSRGTPRIDEAVSVPFAASLGDEWEATFSPDGAQIAYIWNGPSGRDSRNLYIKPVSGGTPLRLTNGPWRDQFPRWSPDGQWIALGRLQGTGVDILLLSPDGARQRTLAHLDSPAYRGEFAVQWVSWLAGGTSLAIIDRPTMNDPYAVYRLSLETGERVQLTSPENGTVGDRQCAFSPDGRWLAFVRYHNDTSSDLYVASADGQDPRRLTHDRIYHHGLAWSPDSRALIYGAQRQSSTWGLWRLPIPAFGTASPERIAGAQEDASWPAVALAPGGEALRIAYTQSRLTVNVHRWDDPAAGGAAPSPLCPSSRSDLAVQYSPDGSRVAFVSSREGWREIFVCNADGTQPLKVTSLRGEYTDSPRWSPDGHRLVFTTSFEENRDVWIADLRTGALRRFTEAPSHEGRATWSADGRWIYFRSNRSGNDEIWKAPVENGAAAVQITRNGAFEAFEALDGSRLYFTKVRALRGLWSIPTNGGEETFVTEDVREGWWSVASDGIYFLVGQEIRVYRFSTARVERVAALPGSPRLRIGFSARRDGRSFAWCQETRNDNDILMLEAPVL